MSTAVLITGSLLVQELAAARDLCTCLDDDHYDKIRDWGAEEYVGHLLNAFQIKTQADLVTFIEELWGTCRVLTRDRPVRERHYLEFAKTITDIGGGLEHHIRHNLPVGSPDTPTRQEFEDLISRLLVGLGQVWGLVQLR